MSTQLFALKRPRLPGNISPDAPPSDYSSAISGEKPVTSYPPSVAGTVSPAIAGTMPPPSDPRLTANPGTDTNLRSALSSPPQISDYRHPLGVGKSVAAAFLGPQWANTQNGMRDYSHALTDYQAKTGGLTALHGMDVAAQQAELNRQNIESEIGRRQAQTDYEKETEPLSLGPGMPTVDIPRKSIGMVAARLAGAGGTTGAAQIKADTAETIAAGKEPSKGNDFEQFYKDYITDNKFPDTAHNRLLARAQYASAGQTPQRPQQQLAIGPDGKVIELKPGAQVTPGTKTVGGELGNAKTNNDEQRRADLASNLSENLDHLEDIARRRPELFGPLAGRLTGARQWAGTDDPDIAALKNIEEQTGLAMVGTHSMRSAQHAEKAAQSITGANKNTAAALLAPNGPIASARASLKTFLEPQPVVGKGLPSPAPSSGGGNLSNFHVNQQTGERIGWDGKQWQPAPAQ